MGKQTLSPEQKFIVSHQNPLESDSYGTFVLASVESPKVT